MSSFSFAASGSDLRDEDGGWMDSCCRSGLRSCRYLSGDQAGGAHGLSGGTMKSCQAASLSCSA